MKEAVEAFIGSPSLESEQTFIDSMDQACPYLLETLTKSVQAYLKNPQSDTTKYSLKQVILSTDAQFSEAYGKELGADDLEQIYNAIFNSVLRGKNKLKISHVKQMSDFSEEEIAKTSQNTFTGILAKEDMARQFIIGSKLAILANSIKQAYPLSLHAITMKKEFLDQIAKLLLESKDKNKNRSLSKLRNDINEFFDNRLFYDAEITKQLITHIEKINSDFNTNIDSLGIIHTHEEFYLTQAIHSIEEHAKSYQAEFPDDARIVKNLAEDLTNLTSDFFAAGDFEEATQQGFLERLSTTIQENQSVLAKHHGWSEVLENIALAVTSIFLLGIVPALFKFYKRTIENDSTFSYLPSRAEVLAKDTLQLAKQVTPKNSIKPSS